MPKILRNFELVEKIASGGMGTVYRGIQLSLKRPVAVKELHPQLSQQKEYIKRFEQEALVLGAMFNENIVGIIDFGHENGTYYIVMEYVDGLSLSEIIDSVTGLAPNMALTIIENMARGLAFAHNKGIIHRDLKPANIILSLDGVIKITDFGLCRPIHESDITQHSSLMGTPRYMSPEQALGKPIDQRSDIYSLGILFFELLTGFYAIWSENTAQILHQVAFGKELDTKRLPTKLNKKIVKLVKDLTTKKVSKRFDNCNEILSTIRKIRNSEEEFQDPANLIDLLYSMEYKSSKDSITQILEHGSRIDVTTQKLDISDNIYKSETPSNQQSKFLDKYFHYFGKLSDFNQDNFIARYYDYFEFNESYHQILTAIMHNKSVLCIGRPASGKTRNIMQALESLKRTHSQWQLIIPKAVEMEQISKIDNYIDTGNCFIVWDDLDQFIPYSDIGAVFNRIENIVEKMILLGTLRSGDEFLSVETTRTDWFYFFDTRVYLKDLTDSQAVSLAKNIDAKSTASFDGTPGSIVLDLSKVKARYNGLTNPNRGILKAMKMLHIIGIRNFKRNLLQKLANSFFGCNLDGSNISETMHSLIDNAFVKRENDNYRFYHSTYAEKVITDYVEPDLNEDMRNLIKFMMKFKDPYHLVSLSNYLTNHDYDENIIQICDLAIEIKPDYAKAYSLRGLQKCKNDNFREAIDDFDKSISLKPNSADFLNNRGVAKSYLGDFEAALDDYNKALDLKSDNSETYYNRGTVFYNLGLSENALNDYDKTLELSPEYAPAYNNRGILKTYEFGDYEGALKDYESAIELDGQYEHALYNRGNLHLYYLQSYEKAIADYDRAIAIKPDFAEAWYNRGLAYIYRKDIDNALNSFAHVVNLSDWGKNTLADDEDLIIWLEKHPKIKSEFTAKINHLIRPYSINGLNLAKTVKKSA
ncbi:MAG: protein kinase domain-containing protein [Candidatus Zixiibacteriota bacterium]